MKKRRRLLNNAGGEVDRQELRWRIVRRGKVAADTHTQTHAQLTAPPPFITDRVCCRCTVSERDRKDVGDP